MSTTLLIVLILAGVIVAVIASRSRKRLGPGTSGPGWGAAIEGAAGPLAGRPAIAAGDAQLRAEIEGVTVTVKAQGDVATGEAPLYPGAKELRLVVGSGLAKPSEDVSHIPEVALPPALALEPPVFLRSDDATRAVDIVEQLSGELDRMRRNARGQSIELFVRGGSVKLTVRGAAAKPETIDAVARTTARVVAAVGGDRARAEAAVESMPKPAAPAIERCTFCDGERRAGVAWVRCDRCSGPYHAECWNTGGRCTRPECGSLKATPI